MVLKHGLVEAVTMPLFFNQAETPVGKLKLVASESALVAVLWEREPPGRVILDNVIAAAQHPILSAAERQLAEYFSRRRTAFELPLDPRGSRFQQRVWLALRRIPFGATRTYSQLAEEIGMPGAARAVGAANGRNPLSIIVPCHRVIGADGSLTGFAGGLETKAKLLQLEAGKAAGLHERLF